MKKETNRIQQKSKKLQFTDMSMNSSSTVALKETVIEEKTAAQQTKKISKPRNIEQRVLRWIPNKQTDERKTLERA